MLQKYNNIVLYTEIFRKNPLIIITEKRAGKDIRFPPNCSITRVKNLPRPGGTGENNKKLIMAATTRVGNKHYRHLAGTKVVSKMVH